LPVSITSVVDAFLVVCAALLPIVNPIGSSAIFLTLTGANTTQQRNALSAKIAVNSFLVLVIAMFVGSYVLDFFGISLPIVRIAGGVLLAGLGWKLLNSDPAPDPDHAAANAHPNPPEAFYPLTLPLTVGPGCIAISITLGAQRPKLPGLEQLLLYRGAMVFGLVVIALSVFLCYRFADRLAAYLGHAGTNVVMRLSAFILLCIGLQIVWAGWTALAAAH
jgi:multiple antibiotic resistance protein